MTKKLKNIGIIGAGNMGQAILKGLKSAKFKKDIFIFEKNREKSKKISQDFKVRELRSLEALVNNSEIIIICVKPQDIDDLLQAMGTLSLRNKLLISIAAGVTTTYLLKKLKAKVAIVRVMPNINAFVEESVNAICVGKYASKVDLYMTQKIFDRLGENFNVSEKKMDAITAISGSGPAYMALFIKALLSAAKRNGLSEEEAKKIIIQTLSGTLVMLGKNKIKLDAFIKRVKSKGGTTEAAFEVFKRKGFELSILEAISAAKKRSVKLGKK
jgi:pyrroline-5-carboxylate reductase